MIWELGKPVITETFKATPKKVSMLIIKKK